MPSKNKPNAFLVYANTIKQRLIREGHVISSTADLVSAAGPYWKELPEEEKNVYKNMAKHKKASAILGQRTERPGRRDNTGELIANRINPDEVRRQRRIKERMEIARQWAPGRDVINERFYFISFSVMLDLRHLELEDFEKIVPCEVSLCEYSIDQGIERVMHKFINPGALRLGQRGIAIEKSERTHKIPIEGMAEEGDTYLKIYEDICQFIISGKKAVPPVFCKITEVEQTEMALKWLVSNSGKSPVVKKVYELEGLLLGLESHLAGKTTDLEDSIATKYLSSSVFDYERNTRCKYHEDLDLKHCSMGMVKKCGYLFSDYLCPKADVVITANHLPCVEDDPDEQPSHSLQPQWGQSQSRQKEQFQQQQNRQRQDQFKQQQQQQQAWGQQQPQQPRQQQQQQQHMQHQQDMARQQQMQQNQYPQQARPQQQQNQHINQQRHAQQQQQQMRQEQQQQQHMRPQQYSQQQQQQFMKQQQQLRQQQQQLQRNQPEIRRENEGNQRNFEAAPKPQHVIGRGRGLSQLTQQRRPGERRDQLGRGRSSAMQRNFSEPSNMGSAMNMNGLRTSLDESLGASCEEPSTRPKPPHLEQNSRYAQVAGAPPASFAPPPPREWRFQ